MTEELFLQFFASGEGDAAPADSESENQTAEASSDTENTEDKAAEFEKLIKGKYADEFARRTQSIIDRRFAKAKETQQTLEKLNPLLKELKEAYPEADSDNIAELIQAIRKGHTPETTKTDKTIMKLREMKNSLNEKKAAHERKNIIDDWEKQGAALKEIYPSFNLSEAVSQTDFAQLLKAGVSVRKAYEVANLENILGSAMHYAAGVAGRKTAQSIRNSSSRVQENSVLDKAASMNHTDVNQLTPKDIMKILDEVKKGAKIRF